MEPSKEKIDAQFAKYLKKVVHNTATNYYKKKYRYEKYESLLENFGDESLYINPKEISFPTLLILDFSMILDDEEIAIAITKLSEREQLFLLEKFLLGKTDKEIGKSFGITRQGVTNLKHRTYKKIKDEYNLKKSNYS